jgi:monovalent cation:proton antiporter-2 (CPA2) family protein
MCAAIVIVPIFQKAGFGSVLGYLISGTLIGPSGLGLIRDTTSISHFAELGVIFLLFVIGLEIQPQKLWAMRRHLIGLGGMQIVVTTLVMAVLGAMFGLPWPMAFVLGFGLSLSSTAFALQTLKEKGQFNTVFGRSAFAILLMQDIAAIPALAIIPLLAAANSQGPTLASLGWGVVIVIALIVVSRFLLRPAFRMIAATHNREIFTAAILSVVIGVAYAMESVGLSAALGTFIAGVLLAESEYRHEIEADLEPFKALLLGLFFISVGMGVHLPLIGEAPFTIFGLTVLYIGLKFLTIYGSGRVFELSHETSKLMALCIVQGGEFAFVIFGLATQIMGVTSEKLDMLTVVITLSMALSPMLSMAHDFILRRRKQNIETVYDHIEGESPEVIIAGFGRVGQVFGRLLRAQGIPFVAIEHDSEQIELLRKFGTKVYYGDASRKDILEAAGAANAKYFILAISNLEASLATVETIKSHFPKLKIFARARNRGHVYDLLDLGVYKIRRETFDSSVLFVGDLFLDMGVPAARVNTILDKFRVHDEMMMLEQHKVRHDDTSLVSLSKQGTAQLAQVLSEDETKSYIAPLEPNSGQL